MPQPARFIHTIVRATALLPLFLSPLLLAAAGLLAPAIAEEDGGAAAGGAAAAAEELDSVNEIEARYQPLLPLETTNVGVAYELFRQPNGELAATVIMPSWDNVEECELFPAMDLMAFIGHVSRRDPGFKALALELAAWSMPPDATNIASIQLAMVHAYGGDPEAEGMPELSVVGDATSLMDDVYEVIILHPGNIPIAGAMVVPVEGGDSFGISMLWAGTLPALDPPDADPDVAGMADMGAESAAEDRFYIPPRCRPPTELMATGELDCYEVIRKSDGKPVTTLFVPAWARLVIAGKLPAMDLARLMSEISQLDNSYQDVGATLLAQEAPAEMPNLPCYQLQVIHSICGDAEHAESMPEFEPYGDSTMLRGAERSCIIVHPRNVPIFGALAYPQCEGDDFNNLLTIIGELVFVD